MVKFSQLRFLDDSLKTGPINTGKIKELLSVNSNNYDFHKLISHDNYENLKSSLHISCFKDKKHFYLRPKFEKTRHDPNDAKTSIYATYQDHLVIFPNEMTFDDFVYKIEKCIFRMFTGYTGTSENANFFGASMAYLLPQYIEYTMKKPDNSEQYKIIIETKLWIEKEIENVYQNRLVINLKQINLLNNLYKETEIFSHSSILKNNDSERNLLNESNDSFKRLFAEKWHTFPIKFLANTVNNIKHYYYGWDGSYKFGNDKPPFYAVINNSYAYSIDSEEQKISKAKRYFADFLFLSPDYLTNIRITNILPVIFINNEYVIL